MKEIEMEREGRKRGREFKKEKKRFIKRRKGKGDKMCI